MFTLNESWYAGASIITPPPENLYMSWYAYPTVQCTDQQRAIALSVYIGIDVLTADAVRDEVL